MREEIFRMERVTYTEQEVVLLEDFHIQIYCGEIMGMLYANAHGMSTFLKLLQTNLPLYDGYVYYGGECVNSWKESRKNQNRISIIGPEKRLVDRMSVYDNVFVFRQGFRQEIIRTELLKKQLVPFLEDIGMDIPVDGRVDKLSVFERVVVELLRAVVMGCRLIVLHEVGNLVSYEELKKLHEIMRHYIKKGFSFLYICPHFEEMVDICDRAALFSNGRIQKIIRKEEMHDSVLKLYKEEYTHMIRSRLERKKKQEPEKKIVLELEHIRGDFIRDTGFCVFRGECLAVQIADNQVFLEMNQILTGDKRLESGIFRTDGKTVQMTGNPMIAVVPEMATKSMVFPGLDYMENLCISMGMRVPSVWHSRRIRSSIRKEYGPVLGEEVFDTPVEELSEKQKYQMIYTRILLQKPQVVFCIQPFKGADRSHRIFIWKMLGMLLDQGIAVVIVALNLSDALSLADRLLMVEADGKEKEIRREDFSSIPETVPWSHLYKKD